MKVYIDGKEILVQNDVMVVYDDVCIDMDADTGEEEYGELHAKLTHEGLILDLIPDDYDTSYTCAYEYGEMATWCH